MVPDVGPVDSACLPGGTEVKGTQMQPGSSLVPAVSDSHVNPRGLFKAGSLARAGVEDWVRKEARERQAYSRAGNVSCVEDGGKSLASQHDICWYCT